MDMSMLKDVALGLLAAALTYMLYRMYLFKTKGGKTYTSCHKAFEATVKKDYMQALIIALLVGAGVGMLSYYLVQPSTGGGSAPSSSTLLGM